MPARGEHLRAGLESIGSAVVGVGRACLMEGMEWIAAGGQTVQTPPLSHCAAFSPEPGSSFFSEEEDGPSAGSLGGLDAAAHMLGRMPACRGGSGCHCRPHSGSPG